MAGLSGGFLKDLDVTLDEPCLRGRDSFLGAGGVMVFDDTRDMVEIAAQAMSFFAHESCGKCFPCRIGRTGAPVWVSISASCLQNYTAAPSPFRHLKTAAPPSRLRCRCAVPNNPLAREVSVR